MQIKFYLQTGDRMVVVQGWGEGRMGSYCLTGAKVQFGKIKNFWGWMVVMVA